MDTAAALIEALRERGIDLIPDPPKLTVKPSSKLTDADRELIRTHKAELLALLKSETLSVAALDAKPNERDRLGDLGADHERTSVTRSIPRLPVAGHPAYSLIETCRRYGVALRLDAAGDLVIGKVGAKADEATQPWPSLLLAIEAHIDAVASLLKVGWVLRSDFPKEAAV